MFFSRLRQSAFKLTSKSRATTMAAPTPLQWITSKTLSAKMLEEKDAQDPTFAVIDVRDDDYIGGHIKGSWNIPAHQLDAMMPTLLRKLKDKKTVVFHCMLSQQRGPKAARRYMQEREAALGKEEAEGQTVYVLGQGFSGWMQEYKNDERLTEGYRKEVWED